MTELQNDDVAAFCNFVCMDPAMFYEFLTRVVQGLKGLTHGTAKPSILIADLPLHSASWQLVRDTKA